MLPGVKSSRVPGCVKRGFAETKKNFTVVGTGCPRGSRSKRIPLGWLLVRGFSHTATMITTKVSGAGSSRGTWLDLFSCLAEGELLPSIHVDTSWPACQSVLRRHARSTIVNPRAIRCLEFSCLIPMFIDFWSIFLFSFFPFSSMVIYLICIYRAECFYFISLYLAFQLTQIDASNMLGMFYTVQHIKNNWEKRPSTEHLSARTILNSMYNYRWYFWEQLLHVYFDERWRN